MAKLIKRIQKFRVGNVFDVNTYFFDENSDTNPPPLLY